LLAEGEEGDGSADGTGTRTVTASERLGRCGCSAEAEVGSESPADSGRGTSDSGGGTTFGTESNSGCTPLVRAGSSPAAPASGDNAGPFESWGSVGLVTG
jgi:hypothetical protein